MLVQLWYLNVSRSTTHTLIEGKDATFCSCSWMIACTACTCYLSSEICIRFTGIGEGQNGFLHCYTSEYCDMLREKGAFDAVLIVQYDQLGL